MKAVPYRTQKTNRDNLIEGNKNVKNFTSFHSCPDFIIFRGFSGET